MSRIYIDRVFYGGYVPDNEKLKLMGFRKSKFLSVMPIFNSKNGFGIVSGAVFKIGNSYPSAPVMLYTRGDRQLLWETKSKADGTYTFRNIAKGLECFVVAFDPSNQYNAVIQDKVIAK